MKIEKKQFWNCQICGQTFYYDKGYKGHLTKHQTGIIDNTGKVNDLFKRGGLQNIKAKIDKIIQSNIGTVNSFVDNEGHNHYYDTVNALVRLFRKYRKL
jgi:uncharacterized C2H2 Zn-finger protein